MKTLRVVSQIFMLIALSVLTYSCSDDDGQSNPYGNSELIGAAHHEVHPAAQHCRATRKTTAKVRRA